MITSAASPAAIHTNSEISTFDICCSEISVFILTTSGSTLSEQWVQAQICMIPIVMYIKFMKQTFIGTKLRQESDLPEVLLITTIAVGLLASLVENMLY